jgi:hypothetical protein
MKEKCNAPKKKTHIWQKLHLIIYVTVRYGVEFYNTRTDKRSVSYDDNYRIVLPC